MDSVGWRVPVGRSSRGAGGRRRCRLRQPWSVCTKTCFSPMELDRRSTEDAGLRRCQMRPSVEDRHAGYPHVAVGHPAIQQSQHEVPCIRGLGGDRVRDLTRHDQRELVDRRFTAVDGRGHTSDRTPNGRGHGSCDLARLREGRRGHDQHQHAADERHQDPLGHGIQRLPHDGSLHPVGVSDQPVDCVGATSIPYGARKRPRRVNPRDNVGDGRV